MPVPGIVAAVVYIICLLFGPGRGDPPPTQETQPQCEQKDLAKDSNNPCGSKNATSVPTPALLPGLIGLGAAALHKRKSAIVTPED